MLTSGSSLRFSSTEIDRMQNVGLDVTGVKSRNGFATAAQAWVMTMAEARPDWLELLAEFKEEREREQLLAPAQQEPLHSGRT